MHKPNVFFAKWRIGLLKSSLTTVCSFSMSSRNNMRSWSNLFFYLIPNSICQLNAFMVEFDSRLKTMSLKLALGYSMFWFIWKMRNSILFKGDKYTPLQFLKMLKSLRLIGYKNQGSLNWSVWFNFSLMSSLMVFEDVKILVTIVQLMSSLF